MNRSNNSINLLIVDDEDDLREILLFNLESEGYNVDVAASGEEALELLSAKEYSLVLLDVMMDGISGFKTAELIKKNLKLSVPIIFLTAKDSENDMLTGFNIGADDYISKPFSLKEVIARVRAVLRRAEAAKPEDVIEVEGIVIDVDNKSVKVKGVDIQLTRKEFDILSLLMEKQGRTFSREDILNRVWGHDQIVMDRTVDVHITRLRKKLGDCGSYITNRSNYGYSFIV